MLRIDPKPNQLWLESATKHTKVEMERVSCGLHVWGDVRYHEINKISSFVVCVHAHLPCTRADN